MDKEQKNYEYRIISNEIKMPGLGPEYNERFDIESEKYQPPDGWQVSRYMGQSNHVIDVIVTVQYYDVFDPTVANISHTKVWSTDRTTKKLIENQGLKTMLSTKETIEALEEGIRSAVICVEMLRDEEKSLSAGKLNPERVYTYQKTIDGIEFLQEYVESLALTCGYSKRWAAVDTAMDAETQRLIRAGISRSADAVVERSDRR